MNQDPSDRTNREIDGEIEQDIAKGAPSSYSWIDEYTESRIPTLKTRRRPARKKTPGKATKAKKRPTAKSKSKVKNRTRTRTRKTSKTRPAKKRTGKARTRSTKTKKARTKKAGKGRAKKKPKVQASRSLATPIPRAPAWTTHVDPLVAVTNSIRSMPVSGRFGHKVFVSAIWDQIGRRIGMDLPTFKRWLLDQNRQGNLTLARADLVGAMDPILVKESEILDRGATFHFVLDKDTLDRSRWGVDWR